MPSCHFYTLLLFLYSRELQNKFPLLSDESSDYWGSAHVLFIFSPVDKAYPAPSTVLHTQLIRTSYTSWTSSSYILPFARVPLKSAHEMCISRHTRVCNSVNGEPHLTGAEREEAKQ